MSNSHISPQEYQAQLASNKMKTYQSLDQEMHILYKRDTDDDCGMLSPQRGNFFVLPN